MRPARTPSPRGLCRARAQSDGPARCQRCCDGGGCRSCCEHGWSGVSHAIVSCEANQPRGCGGCRRSPWADLGLPWAESERLCLRPFPNDSLRFRPDEQETQFPDFKNRGAGSRNGDGRMTTSSSLPVAPLVGKKLGCGDRGGRHERDCDDRLELVAASSGQPSRTLRRENNTASTVTWRLAPIDVDRPVSAMNQRTRLARRPARSPTDADRRDSSPRRSKPARSPAAIRPNAPRITGNHLAVRRASSR